MSVFGRTIALAAGAARVPPELMLVYLTSVIGGLSGVFSRVRGIFGEDRHPAISQVLVVDHPAVADALARIAVGPAIWYHDAKKRNSLYRFPEEFDDDPGSPPSSISETQKVYADMMAPSGTIPLEEDIKRARRELLKHRQHGQPSVMLLSPSPATFDDLCGEVFDGFPLLFDPEGNMITRAVDPTTDAQPWRDLVERITTAATSGLEQQVTGGMPTLHRMTGIHTPALVHVRGNVIGPALHAAATRRFLQSVVALPTVKIGGRIAQPYRQAARDAVRHISAVVKRMITTRFDDGQVYHRCDAAGDAFADGVEVYHDQLDDVTGDLRQYTGPLVGLPQRLLWTALEIEGSTRHAARLGEGALQAATWCKQQHLGVIRSALDNWQQERMVDDALVMFNKLVDLSKDPPCTVRRLVRCYSIQQRDHHEPVLAFLDQEGVIRRDGNRIILTEPDPAPRWLRGGPPDNQN